MAITNLFSTFWNHIISIGIIAGLSDGEAKRIRLTNGICIITGSVAISVSIVSMGTDILTTKGFSITLLPGIVAISSGLMAWACTLLNYYKRYNSSKYVLFVLWWIIFTSYGIIYGKEIRIDQYLITIFVLPLAFFDKKLEISFFSIVTISLFAGIQIIYQFFEPVIRTPESFAPYRYAIHTAFMLTSLYAVVYYFKYQNEKNEKAIKVEIKIRKKAEDELRIMAYHDPLTGLLNRKSFEEKLENNLNQSQRREDYHTWAIMYLDLDKFKQINDTLGHEIGDEVLKIAAKRILSCLRKTDFLFRIGGDEFTIILNNLKADEDALSIREKICVAINREATIKGEDVQFGVSIGLAFYPKDGKEPGTLIKKADLSMYADKDSKKTKANK